MKTVGLIGGMSWESTQHYYKLMNQYVHERLGGHHSIEAIIYSVNFERILVLVHQNQWDAVGQEISSLAKKTRDRGCKFSDADGKCYSQSLPSSAGGCSRSPPSHRGSDCKGHPEGGDQKGRALRHKR